MNTKNKIHVACILHSVLIINFNSNVILLKEVCFSFHNHNHNQHHHHHHNNNILKAFFVMYTNLNSNQIGHSGFA